MEFTQPGGASITLNPGGTITIVNNPNALLPPTVVHDGASTAALDTSTFQSVTILATTINTTTTDVHLTWIDDSSGTWSTWQEDFTTPVDIGAAFYSTPCKGTKLIIKCSNSAGADTSLAVIASAAPVHGAHYINQQQTTATGTLTGGIDDGMMEWDIPAVPAAAVATRAHVGSANGPARLTAKLNTNASTWDVLIEDTATGAFLGGQFAIPANPANTIVSFALQLGNRPVDLVIVNHDPAATPAARLALSYTP